MKQNPVEKAIQERMAAGALTLDGFLGTDTRGVDEIIAADRARIIAAGVTHKELAEFLQSLHEAADSGLETEVAMFDGRLSVRMIEGMGRIPCPFACGAVCHKGEIHLTDGDDELVLAPLQIHMIVAHGFFEGQGAKHRIEPEILLDWMKRASGAD